MLNGLHCVVGFLDGTLCLLLLLLLFVLLISARRVVRSACVCESICFIEGVRLEIFPNAFNTPEHASANGVLSDKGVGLVFVFGPLSGASCWSLQFKGKEQHAASAVEVVFFLCYVGDSHVSF